MSFQKYRVYVDSPDEVPDEYEVQEGQQGGLFYEVESGGGDEDTEPEDPDEQNLEYDGYDVNEFGEGANPGVEITDGAIEEGDLLYVEHPDGDYIAEVDSLEAGWSDWRIEFGGGTYHLDEDTVSTPVGVVEDTPDLDPNQTVVPGDPSEGDIVAWDDPAGFTHYTPAEDVPADGDVQGIVETQEPDEPSDVYDLPESPEDIESDVDPQEAMDFNSDLAESVMEGDATELPAYEFMSYAGSIQDPELAADAYKSILNNDGNKTQRERMERRLRGMGLDPEDYKSADVDPESVPTKRKGTVWSGFESERAINVAAAAADLSTFNNWETWNDFFDHMTQPELEEALEKAATQKPMQGVGMTDDPLDYDEDGWKDVEMGDIEEYGVSYGISAIMSRMEEGSAEKVKSVSQEMPDDNYPSIEEFGATFLKSADDRRKIYETEGSMDHNKMTRVQFDDSMDPENRLEKIADIHTSGTKGLNNYGLRAMMWGYSGKDEDAVNGFNRDMPVGPLEPTEEVEKALESNQQRIKEQFEKAPDEPWEVDMPPGMTENINDDGTITVYRGVKETVTGHSPVESWSTDKSTSNSFDGEGILKLRAKPEDILVAHGFNHDKYASEEEVTLLGGEIAGRASAIEGDPIELMLKGLVKFDPDEGDFFFAPNDDWVEAAIYDDMFDPGMGPRMREARDEQEGGESESEEKTKGIDRLVEEIAHKAVERLWKYRVYIDDPSEAPDDVNVQEGQQGGTYYETDSSGEDDAAPDPGEVETRYDVDSGFGVEVAEAIEAQGDPVGEISASQWQRKAGEIDDPDLLLDALNPIQDHGTKTARDRIRRRLRGLGWKSETIDEAVEYAQTAPEPDTHEEWQGQYSPEAVERTMTLKEAGASEGVASGRMEVHELEDGTEAYVTEVPEDDSKANEMKDRTMVAYEFSRAAGGSVPPHTETKVKEMHYPSDTVLESPAFAVREAKGKEMWESPDSWKANTDVDEAAEEMAIQLLAGNIDAHGENVFIDADGNLSFIDLDHSAGALDGDQASQGHKNHYRRAMAQFRSTLQNLYEKSEEPESMEEALDSNEAEAMIQHHASMIADELKDDEELFDRLSEHNEEMAKNIRHNIDLILRGELQ